MKMCKQFSVQFLRNTSYNSFLKPVDCLAHGSRAVGQHDSVIMAVVVDAKVLYDNLSMNTQKD